MTSWPPVWRTSITMRRMNAASSTTRMRAISPRWSTGRGRPETGRSDPDVQQRARDLVLGPHDRGVRVVGDAAGDQAPDLLGEVDALVGGRRDGRGDPAAGGRGLVDALGVEVRRVHVGDVVAHDIDDQRGGPHPAERVEVHTTWCRPAPRRA